MLLFTVSAALATVACLMLSTIYLAAPPHSRPDRVRYTWTRLLVLLRLRTFAWPPRTYSDKHGRMKVDLDDKDVLAGEYARDRKRWIDRVAATFHGPLLKPFVGKTRGLTPEKAVLRLQYILLVTLAKFCPDAFGEGNSMSFVPSDLYILSKAYGYHCLESAEHVQQILVRLSQPGQMPEGISMSVREL